MFWLRLLFCVVLLLFVIFILSLCKASGMADDYAEELYEKTYGGNNDGDD